MTIRVILRAVNVLRTPFRDRSVIVAHRAVESVALKRQSPLKRRIYSQKEDMRSAHRRSCPVLSVLPSGGDVWRKRIRAAANYRGFQQASPGDAGRKVDIMHCLACGSPAPRVVRQWALEGSCARAQLFLPGDVDITRALRMRVAPRWRWASPSA
jgi:hypothetical protein